MNWLLKLKMNNKGMTLIEVLVALVVVAILVFTFIPFMTNSFYTIIKVGEQVIELENSKSTIDEAIAKKDFFVSGSFPLNFDSGASYSVAGTLIFDGELSTFLAFDTVVSNSGSITEGYLGNGDTYRAGDDLHVDIAGQNIHLSNVGGWRSSTISRFVDKNGDTVEDVTYSLIIHNSSSGEVHIEAGLDGLTNELSPYNIEITTRYGFFFTWFTEKINIGFQVSMPMLVAVGEGGDEVICSDIDKNVWLNTKNDIVNRDLKDIEYMKDTYVAVGDYGSIYYRRENEGWTQATTGLTNDINKITYINGQFIVIGEDGLIGSSVNGISWTFNYVTDINSVSTGYNLTGVDYFENKYYVCIDNENITDAPSLVANSTDLITWSTPSLISPTLINCMDILNDGVHLIALGEGNVIGYFDGTTWNVLFSSEQYMSLTKGDNPEDNIVLVGEDGNIGYYLNDDITTINSPTIPSLYDFYDVTFTCNKYYAVGFNNSDSTNLILVSDDGETWYEISDESILASSTLYGIAGRQ